MAHGAAVAQVLGYMHSSKEGADFLYPVRQWCDGDWSSLAGERRGASRVLGVDGRGFTKR